MSDEIVEKHRRVRFLRVCSENLYTNDYFLFYTSTLTAAKKREVFKYRFFSLNILPLIRYTSYMNFVNIIYFISCMNINIVFCASFYVSQWLKNHKKLWLGDIKYQLCRQLTRLPPQTHNVEFDRGKFS